MQKHLQAAGDKGWKKLETIPAWDVRKVKSQKEVKKEAQKNNKKVHLVSLMDTSSWPKSWEYIEDPVLPLERNLYGHRLAGLLWERPFEKSLLELGCEKVPNWERLLVHRSTLMTSKWLGKKHNLALMWKKLMNIEEPNIIS